MTTTTETFVPAYICQSCHVQNMVEIKNGAWKLVGDAK